MVGRTGEDELRRYDRPRVHAARPRQYEESIGRLPRQAVGGYYDLEEGRLHAFLRWWDRLKSPWGTLLFAGLAAGLFLAGILGAAIMIWSKGGIIGSAIGLVIVGIVVVVSGHLGSQPGGPKG